MLEILDGIQTVWNSINNTEKPILMYGMGNGAEKVAAVLKDMNIKIDGIFASDEFVRGQLFLGFRVMTYNEAMNMFGDFAIILAFGTSIPELMEKIINLSQKHELFVPDIPLFGGGLFDEKYVEDNKGKIDAAYSLMYDECSRKTFDSIVKYKYSGDIKYLLECETPRQEVFDRIIKFGTDEVYMDLGAYDGDTVEEAVELMNGRYDKIIAVEPAKKNFKKLTSRVLSYADSSRIECINMGIYSKRSCLSFSGKSGRNVAIDEAGKDVVEVDSIDNIAGNSKVTYIKMDIEGAERHGILGGAGIIRKYRPKLTVSAYHRTGDIFELPLLIHSVNSDYKIFLRHHPYIPAWETNIYAI